MVVYTLTDFLNHLSWYMLLLPIVLSKLSFELGQYLYCVVNICVFLNIHKAHCSFSPYVIRVERVCQFCILKDVFDLPIVAESKLRKPKGKAASFRIIFSLVRVFSILPEPFLSKVKITLLPSSPPKF